MDHKTIYVEFPQNGITTEKPDFQFERELQNAVMQMLWRTFDEDWRLDGDWEQCAKWDTVAKPVFFGLAGNLTTYKGVWIKLRRTYDFADITAHLGWSPCCQADLYRETCDCGQRMLRCAACGGLYTLQWGKIMECPKKNGTGGNHPLRGRSHGNR